MKAIDIRSESAIKLLAEFLDMDLPYPYEAGRRFPNAEHFAHGKLISLFSTTLITQRALPLFFQSTVMSLAYFQNYIVISVHRTRILQHMIKLFRFAVSVAFSEFSELVEFNCVLSSFCSVRRPEQCCTATRVGKE